MNYFVIPPLYQIADSTKKASFLEQNNTFSQQNTSILSADFQSDKIDSIVEIVTKKRRVRIKKLKILKLYASDLKVQKDSFFFLNILQTPSVRIYQFPPFKSILNQQDTIEKDTTLQITQNNTALELSNIDTTVQLTNIDSTLQSYTRDTLTNTSYTPLIKKDETDLGLSHSFWIAGVLFLSVFLLAYTRFMFRSRLNYYSKALLNFTSFHKMIKERNAVTYTVSSLLNVIFIINISFLLLFTFIEYHQHITSSSFYLFIKILLSVGSFLLILYILHHIIGFITEAYSFINEYNSNIFYFFHITGITLFPFIILYPYISNSSQHYLLLTAWASSTIIFVIRWLRNFIISFNHRVSFFYMILYLCALEILPLLVVLKLIEESY